jgi:hypothetical protein
MFAGILFKGALIFISRDFLHQEGKYVAASGVDALEYAAAYNSVLPTPELVDAVYAQATCKIKTPPLNPTLSNAAEIHNSVVTQQKRLCRNLLILDGHKKTIVQSHRPSRTAIYGWFGVDGKAVQPYSTIHSKDYRDYSQGIRLVYRWAIKEGRIVSVEDILNN